MYWYDHGMNGWGYTIMVLGMLGFLALVAIVATALLRRPPAETHTPRASAREVLAERFARGEIDDEEYHRRLAVLEQDRGPQRKTR
jgi:putative membrane protein